MQMISMADECFFKFVILMFSYSLNTITKKTGLSSERKLIRNFVLQNDVKTLALGKLMILSKLHTTASLLALMKLK